MLSWSKRLIAVVAVVAAPALGLEACQPGLPSVGEVCEDIPSGGCPIGRGGSCDDKTCTALYGCYDGKWKLQKACPKNDAGGGGSADGGDAGTDSGEGGGTCTPFSFNHEGEQSRCSPELENPPDCPAAAAEGCLEGACLTGCSDFFLCEKEGWVDVGYCDDDGGFHDTQKK